MSPISLFARRQKQATEIRDRTLVQLQMAAQRSVTQKKPKKQCKQSDFVADARSHRIQCHISISAVIGERRESYEVTSHTWVCLSITYFQCSTIQYIIKIIMKTNYNFLYLTNIF